MQLYYFLQYLLNTSQMWSDLRILVVGFVNKDYSDVFSTLNALVGRQAFSRDRWKEKQEACVEVEGGRRLWLTYMPETLFRDMGDAYSEGRTTELDKIYHCVVIAMMFTESTLSMSYSGVVNQTLSQKFGESFLRKHCVVIVSCGDGFDKARREGRKKNTFLQWCRSLWGIDKFKSVFHGVQERWILFNNNGSQDELKQQRQQLVDIVDTQILVGSHYTDMKFKEVEIEAAKLEKQNLDLKGELEKKTKELIETRASDVQKSEQQFSHLREKTTERSQVLEQQIVELKQQLEEKSKQLLQKTGSVVERQESDSCKMMERSQVLEQLVEQLKQQLEEKTRSIVERQESDSCKMMERSQVLEQLVEQLKQQLEEKTRSVVERQESDSCKMMERLEKLEQRLESLEERQVSDSCKMMERLQELDQRLEEKTMSVVEAQKSDRSWVMQKLQELEQRLEVLNLL